MIFAGTVVAVRMPEGGGGVVEVEFAVSNVVKGVVGGAYGLREWVGLWRDGARYRVGDRRLMLLLAPGPGGLSSPVDGLDGAIPVAPGGVMASGATGAGVGESVDLRWLQAKTLRSAGYGAEGEVRGQVVLGSSAPTVSASVVEGRAALADVVRMLAAWEARRNVGR